MKPRTYTAVCVVMMFLFIGNLAAGKKMISVDEAMKEFEGIYVNAEYSGEILEYPQKIVITKDGNYEEWGLATQTSPSYKGKYKIAECWMDSKGNTYCTVDLRFPIGGASQELWKLQRSKNTLETNFTRTIGVAYPKKIDAKPDPGRVPVVFYAIRYRQ